MKKTVFMLFLLSACASPQAQQMEASKEYRMDLELNVNGMSDRGLMVVPVSQAYTINVRAPGDSELVTLTSCHREVVLPRQRDFFAVKYEPTEVEASGYCPVQISAFSPKFRYAGGLIDFQDQELPAILICNGVTKNVTGVSVCQSREGMVQKIKFPSKVRAGQPANCPPMDKAEGEDFEVNLGKGKCVYAFVDETKKIHRLTTFGYEEFQLR